jgi:hypothetical protein
MDENDVLLADSHHSFSRRKNYIIQLWTAHSVNDVRQIETHRTEPLLPGLSSFEFEIAIGKLKKYKSPDSDKIPAELIQAGGETLPTSMNSLILFGIRKNYLISTSLKKGNETDCSDYHEILLLSTTYNILSEVCIHR